MLKPATLKEIPRKLGMTWGVTKCHICSSIEHSIKRHCEPERSEWCGNLVALRGHWAASPMTRSDEKYTKLVVTGQAEAPMTVT